MSRVPMRWVQRALSLVLPISFVLASPGVALASAPGVSTESASSITGVGATLNGTVNPEGLSTQYRFDYDYSRDPWCQSGGASGSPAGHTTLATLGFTDISPHAVSAAITGFTPGDSICFAVDATNGAQAIGTTATFTTTALVVSTGSASSIFNNSATLNGTINPEGEPISYSFRYGPASSSFCTSGGTSLSDASSSPTTSLGFTDTAAHAVSAAVTGLLPSTSYCDQLVTVNSSFVYTGGNFGPRFTTDAPYTLKVAVTGNGVGEVEGNAVEDQTGIMASVQCGAGQELCTADLVRGEVMTLTANPVRVPPLYKVPYTFSGWTGACSGTTTTCTVTMQADETVGATFTSPAKPPSPSVAGALSSSLKVSAGIAAIARAGGYQTTATIPVPGTLTITWSSGSLGTHGTRSVVVASGSKTFAKAGTAKLKIKLTHAGRALLKRSSHLKLTGTGSFKPKHGRNVTKQRRIRLAR